MQSPIYFSTHSSNESRPTQSTRAQIQTHANKHTAQEEKEQDRKEQYEKTKKPRVDKTPEKGTIILLLFKIMMTIAHTKHKAPNRYMNVCMCVRVCVCV